MAGCENRTRARVGEAGAVEDGVCGDRGWEGRIRSWTERSSEVADVAAHEDKCCGCGTS